MQWPNLFNSLYKGIWATLSLSTPPMASSLLFSLSLLLLPIAAYALDSPTKLGGAPVGGRTEIPDVARNKEVQILGRFSVAEHNKSVRLGNGGGALLSYVRVVKAQSQVVAGMKYYLKIAAADGKGKVGKFDAEVVVRRWANSKTLISFNPSVPDQELK